jgi:hypothetical protein
MNSVYKNKENAMDARTYIDQLKQYATKFVDWWCKPYEKFREHYEKQNRSFISRLIPIRIESGESMKKFRNAVDEFKKETRSRHDLIDEIFNFFDANYEVYLHANDEQRSEIRSVIYARYYPGPQSAIVHYMENFFIDLLWEYLRERAGKELKSTGDKVWLMRGLVAISMENCSVDYRDSLSLLASLYSAAKQKGINPEPIFQEIAKISSHEITRGGGTPMSEMMASVNDSTVRNYS